MPTVAATMRRSQSATALPMALMSMLQTAGKKAPIPGYTGFIPHSQVRCRCTQPVTQASAASDIAAVSGRSCPCNHPPQVVTFRRTSPTLCEVAIAYFLGIRTRCCISACVRPRVASSADAPLPMIAACVTSPRRSTCKAARMGAPWLVVASQARKSCSSATPFRVSRKSSACRCSLVASCRCGSNAFKLSATLPADSSLVQPPATWP